MIAAVTNDRLRTASHTPPDAVVVGRINGLCGTRGWIKVFSYTRPRENLLDYNPWQLLVGSKWRTCRVLGAKKHGAGLIAALQGFDDRDAAATLLQSDIAIARKQLAAPSAGEYYWADLIGMEVRNGDNEVLGKVVGLRETGANDVLQVRGDRERLIPFVEGVYVTAVDLAAGRIEVDWHPDD